MKKTVLITGASRGIGAACARALAADGFRVIVNYIYSEKQARTLAEEIGGVAVRADVSQREQVRKMFDVAGNVDVLVCCAGIAKQELFTDITPEQWRNLFAVNVDGIYHCCQMALPYMIHEKAGKIITMSSIWGITGASCESGYSATKAAVIGLTKALAKELGPSGIQVNCVAPGIIETDMNRTLSPDTMEMLREETPLGKIGTPKDVAELVRFLVSDKADFITGQVFSPNGGFLI